MKFHWVMENDKMKKKYGHLCIIDKYVYINAYSNDIKLLVISSPSLQ